MSKTTDNSSFQASGAYNSRPAKRPREDESSDGVPSKYRIVEDAWGSRPEFQRSYPLGSMRPCVDPEGIEEQNIILEGYQEMDTRTLEDENAELRSFEERQATLDGSQPMDCQIFQEYNAESAQFGENGGQGYFEEEDDGQGCSEEENDGQEYFEDDYSAQYCLEEMIAERAYFKDDDGWGFGRDDGDGWGFERDDGDGCGFERGDWGCGGWEVNDGGWGSPGGNA